MKFNASHITTTAAAMMLGLSAMASHAEVAPTIDPAAPAAVEAAPAAPAAEVAPGDVGPTDSALAVPAKDVQIGSAVFGSDGQQIGEINRVTSEPSGTVTEIEVTTGGKAGLGAEVVAITADKITGISDGVKVSLSAQEAKSLQR